MQEKKLNPKEKTQQDIWESFIKPKYPTLNEHQLIELKRLAAIQWMYDEDTELGKIYDQYVMMKNLMDVDFES